MNRTKMLNVVQWIRSWNFVRVDPGSGSVLKLNVSYITNWLPAALHVLLSLIKLKIYYENLGSNGSMKAEKKFSTFYKDYLQAQ